MATDRRFKRFLRNRSPLNDSFIGDHDGGSGGQACGQILGAPVRIPGFRYGFDGQVVLFLQPGEQFRKMRSGLPFRFV